MASTISGMASGGSWRDLSRAMSGSSPRAAVRSSTSGRASCSTTGAITIWLDAPIDILAERTGRRNNRPLLRTWRSRGNPRPPRRRAAQLLLRGPDLYPQQQRRPQRRGRSHCRCPSQAPDCMTIIKVDTPPSGYEVLVGPVESGLERIRDLSRGNGADPCQRPKGFCPSRLRPLPNLLGAVPLLIPEGEAAKEWAILHQLLAGLADRGVARDTPIIALGGGSVGDVAGLAAALFKRGCPIIHLPTTLLAQADSAIGGKTAIDCFWREEFGRNLPPARTGRRRSCLSRYARRSATALRLCRGGQVWADRRPGLLRLVRGQRPRRSRRAPRPSPAGDCRRNPRQGTNCRRRCRGSIGPARAAQSRP